MTDKQIIIDGVDVSGCENLMQGIVPFGCMEDRKTCSCMNNPNCLYKQLKRKEQECERLKEENFTFENLIKEIEKQGAIEETIQQLDQLKAENEELKKLLKVRIEDLCDACGASSMMPMPCKVYEKTLDQIKQIMKKHCRKCKKHKFYHFQLCCTCKYTDILQKISEVEDDR